jgi:hypothetical protein
MEKDRPLSFYQYKYDVEIPDEAATGDESNNDDAAVYDDEDDDQDS